MKERPILFSGAMVRALLDGRKTQTRRVVKPQPAAGVRVSPFCSSGLEDGHGRELKTPYGTPGDRLWVREAWRIGAWNEDEGQFAIDYCDGARREWLSIPDDHDGEKFNRLWIDTCDELEAKRIHVDHDGKYRWAPGESPCRWRPSIHMPRWVSRITLELTGVRVERLQDISVEDCIAEGMSTTLREHDACVALRDDYRVLWDSLNATRGYGWDANPWVWVVEFKRIEQ